MKVTIKYLQALNFAYVSRSYSETRRKKAKPKMSKSGTLHLYERKKNYFN